MWCPNNSESLAHLVILSPDDLGSRKIDQLHVALRIHHEVFWLDVTADYLVIVEVFQYEDNSCSVKLTVLSGEQSNVTNDLVEILSTHELL